MTPTLLPTPSQTPDAQEKAGGEGRLQYQQQRGVQIKGCEYQQEKVEKFKAKTTQAKSCLEVSRALNMKN